MKFILDGQGLNFQGRDVNGDGVFSAFESLPQSEDITPLTTPSDSKEMLKELNEDRVDGETGMSTIDVKTRLGIFDITPILCVDTLVSFNAYPSKILRLTRQKKRLLVSKDGLGRREMIDMIGGHRDEKARTGGFRSWIGDFVGGKKNDEA